MFAIVHEAKTVVDYITLWSYQLHAKQCVQYQVSNLA